MISLCIHPFDFIQNEKDICHQLLIIENKKMLYSFLKDILKFMMKITKN